MQNDYINPFGGRVALSNRPSTDRATIDVPDTTGVVEEPRLSSDTSDAMKICMPIDVSFKSTVSRLHTFACADAFRSIAESRVCTSTPRPTVWADPVPCKTRSGASHKVQLVEVVECTCGNGRDKRPSDGGGDEVEVDRCNKRWRYACPLHEACNTAKLPTRGACVSLDDGLRGHLVNVAARIDLSRMRLITFFFTALKRALYDPRPSSEVSPAGATLEEERRVGDTALFDVADVMVRSLCMHDDEMSLFILYVDEAARHYDVRNRYGDMRLLLALAVIAHKVCHDEPLTTSAMAEICGLSPSRLLTAEFDIWAAMWDRGVVLGQRTDAMLAVIDLARKAVGSTALDHMFLQGDDTVKRPV